MDVAASAMFAGSDSEGEEDNMEIEGIVLL